MQKGFGISDGRSLKDRFSETCLCWLGLAVPKGTHSNAFQTATPYSDFHLVLRTVFLDLSWNKQPLRGNVITGWRDSSRRAHNTTAIASLPSLFHEYRPTIGSFATLRQDNCFTWKPVTLLTNCTISKTQSNAPAFQRLYGKPSSPTCHDTCALVTMCIYISLSLSLSSNTIFLSNRTYRWYRYRW